MGMKLNILIFGCWFTVGKWNTFTDIAKTSPHTFWHSICGLSVDNMCNASLLISLALSSTRWPVQDTNRWGEPKPPRSCRNPEDRKRERLCSLHYEWLQMTMLMKKLLKTLLYDHYIQCLIAVRFIFRKAELWTTFDWSVLKSSLCA